MQLSRALKSVFAVALLVLLSGFVMTQRGALAQDEESHPAHIHSGTCGDGLGDVVYPLSNVSEAALVNGTPVAGATGGATDAIPVAISGTTVPSTLADLLASPYAINIHESAENIGNYIACGNIGGTMIGTSDLAIGLGELNESGYSGAAWLHDNGDGTTTVSVFLTESHGEGGEGAEGEGTAEASSGDTAATGDVAVDIKDFMFMPAELDIAVGTTVTWTNSDSAPHTATQDGGGFQSNRLDQSASYSFTFDTAGTFEYHCEYHPNMHGTIVVK
jgi:plastocyanin